MRLLQLLVLAVLAGCNAQTSVEEGFLGFSSQGSNSSQSGTTTPSVTSLSINSESGTSSSPVITVIGTALGDVVAIFSDSTCSTQVSSATAAGVSTSVTLSLSSEGSYTFYGKITRAGASSSCSSQSVSYTYYSVDQVDDDNTTAGFGGGTHNGTDSSTGNLRLTSTTNRSTLDASWTPQYASLTNYWPLDDDFNDSAGSNNCTAVDNAQLNSTAKVGSNSALFDGTLDDLTCGDIATMNSSTQFTFSSWIKKASAGGRAIIGYYSSATSRIHISNWSDNQIYFNISATGAQYGLVAHPAGSSTDWHHMVMVYDGSQASNSLRLRAYINGQEVTLSYTGTIQAVMSDKSAGEFTIGIQPGAGSTSGHVDEVAIWSVPLSANEIRTIYERQRPSFSGDFTSRVMDAVDPNSTWANLTSKTPLPFFKPLPGDTDGDNTPDSETSSSYTDITGNLANGLLGYWRFDETSWNGTAGEVKDSSGNGLDGVAVNGAQTNSSGRFGGAALFDGSDDRVDIAGGLTQISADDTHTISFWYNVSNFGSPGDVILSGSSFFFEFNTTVGFYWQTGGLRTYTGVTLVPETWNHVVIVKTGAGDSGSLYLNGVELTTYSGNLGNMPTVTSDLRIGDYTSNTIYRVDGRIDEVAMWGRDLSAAEVVELYRRGANRIKYQIRSCDDSVCSGESWQGPDGTSTSYFSELQNRKTAGVYAATGAVQTDPLTFTFADFTSAPSANRYFQYRAILESDDENTLCSGGTATCNPSIESMTIGPSR